MLFFSLVCKVICYSCQLVLVYLQFLLLTLQVIYFIYNERVNCSQERHLKCLELNRAVSWTNYFNYNNSKLHTRCNLSIANCNWLRCCRECFTTFLYSLMFLEEFRVIIHSRWWPSFTMTPRVQMQLQHRTVCELIKQHCSSSMGYYCAWRWCSRKTLGLEIASSRPRPRSYKASTVQDHEQDLQSQDLRPRLQCGKPWPIFRVSTMRPRLRFEWYRYWGISQYLPVLGGIGIGPILFSVIMPNTGQTTAIPLPTTIW